MFKDAHFGDKTKNMKVVTSFRDWTMDTSGERGIGTRHREGFWGADKGVCLTISYTFVS